jgi:hypothetical protein
MRLNGKINTSKLTHCSLDLFLLQMHSAELAEVLECFSAFGSRIVPLIHKEPDSEAWWISEEVSIQRCHWLAMCRRVMNLLGLLCLDNPADNAQTPFPLRPWPDLPFLRSAAAGVQAVFGDFGDADCAQPTLEKIYWPRFRAQRCLALGTIAPSAINCNNDFSPCTSQSGLN